MAFKLNKFRVLGANKSRKTLKIHELGKELIKEEVGRNIMYVEENISVEDI